MTTRSHRLCSLALGAATLAGGVLVAFPTAAHAAPPFLRANDASCNAGVWTVHWLVDNADATPMTVTAATTTGATSGPLTFGPNPAAPGGSSGATQTFAYGTTGTITAHLTTTHPAQPAVNTTASWTIGSTPVGMTVTDHCTPAPPAVVQDVHVSPSQVAPGGTVTVSGHCQPSSSGFAISPAFEDEPPTHDFAGVGAAPFASAADGSFSTQGIVDPGTAQGHYAVSVRCGGGTLAVSADLVVVGTYQAFDPNATDDLTGDTPVLVTPNFTG